MHSNHGARGACLGVRPGRTSAKVGDAAPAHCATANAANAQANTTWLSSGPVSMSYVFHDFAFEGLLIETSLRNREEQRVGVDRLLEKSLCESGRRPNAADLMEAREAITTFIVQYALSVSNHPALKLIQ